MLKAVSVLLIVVFLVLAAVCTVLVIVQDDPDHFYE
jgi:hypothetical protein